MILNVGKDVELMELWDSALRGVNWKEHFGKLAESNQMHADSMIYNPTPR